MDIYAGGSGAGELLYLVSSRDIVVEGIIWRAEGYVYGLGDKLAWAGCVWERDVSCSGGRGSCFSSVGRVVYEES